jgi:hypothetical protein
MHRLIVNVRGPGLGDVEAVGDGFRCLPEVLLLVALKSEGFKSAWCLKHLLSSTHNKVLRTGLYSGTLNAANRVRKKFASEIGIRTEALPVATTFRRLCSQSVSMITRFGFEAIALPFQDRLPLDLAVR